MATISRRAGRQVLDRVSARVFCHLEEGGGNPVTVFHSSEQLSPQTQQTLAKSCAWESVMIQNTSQATVNNDNSKGSLPQFSFYMPSGEQVSFCAHAAMGAALEVCLQSNDEELDEVSFSVENLEDNETDSDNVKKKSQQEYVTTHYEGDIVALHMSAAFTQITPSQPAALYRVLRDHCGLELGDLASIPSSGSTSNNNSDINERQYDYQICHASIARPKTLIPIRRMQDLHDKAKAPTNPEGFALACKALDDTTGLYLYSKSTEEDGAWECRQFPRASGYPEDPATGIAAAALACHLYADLEIELPAYKFYQGTAMGKPSLIVVDDLVLRPSLKDARQIDAKFRLLGRVEFDQRETIEVPSDDVQ